MESLRESCSWDEENWTILNAQLAARREEKWLVGLPNSSKSSFSFSDLSGCLLSSSSCISDFLILQTLFLSSLLLGLTSLEPHG